MRNRPINMLLYILKARYDGRFLRPMSAPVRRIISLMDNEEPVFGKTHQHFDPQLKDVYPHKGLRTFHLFLKQLSPVFNITTYNFFKKSQFHIKVDLTCNTFLKDFLNQWNNFIGATQQKSKQKSSALGGQVRIGK